MGPTLNDIHQLLSQCFNSLVEHMIFTYNAWLYFLCWSNTAKIICYFYKIMETTFLLTNWWS